MAPTPEAPKDAYEGTPEQIERQKNALVQILGEQGQYGLKQLQNRQSSANMLAQAPSPAQQAGAPVPQDPTQRAMYEAFTRDAGGAIQSHEQEQARIQRANQAYMDQVKAAIPMQQADLASYTESQRMAYEDREKERQAREAAQAAAMARAGGGGGTDYETKLLEKRTVDTKYALEDFEKLPPEQRTASAAAQLGKAGARLSLEDAAAQLGIKIATPEEMAHISPSDPYWGRDFDVMQDAKKVQGMMASFMRDALAEDTNWGDVISAANNMSAEAYKNNGLDKTQISPKAIGLWLAAYAPTWAIDPKSLRG